MIRHITRQFVFDNYKTATSEIVDIQKMMFDSDPLFEDGDDGKWYNRMYDAISISNDDLEKHAHVISFDHGDISTFTTALSEKLTKLLIKLNVSDLIVIAHLKLNFIGNPSNNYPAFQKAVRKFEDISNDLKYEEAFKIELTDLSTLIEIAFWITRCDASGPEYIYFFDANEKIAFYLCKHGGIHIIEYEKEIVSDDLIKSLDMYFVDGHCEEKFSASSKIEGRKSRNLKLCLYPVFFMLFFSNLYSQNVNKRENILYYFYSQDSAFVGVKNQLGNIIIPATHRAGFNYDFEHPITDPVIEFQDTDAQSDRKDSPAIPVGDIYNREGKFLYHAQLFDNGPDYYSEGFRRYVDSGKIGFVDKYGNKVIPAQWNFATPFHYGYSRAYTGKWKKQYDKSGEHWTVVPDAPDADTHMINRKGEKVTPLAKQQNPKDYFSEGNYYPYPFSYTAKEQKIADQLNSLEVLNEIARLRLSNEQEDIPRLQFEITEWPTSHFPYYTLKAYRNQQAEDDYLFTVTKDGKNIFHYSFLAAEEQIPLQKWMVSELEECKKYIRNHPNAPYRFDVKKHLKEWENK